MHALILRLQTQPGADAEAATIIVAPGNVVYIKLCEHVSVSVSFTLLP